MEDLPCLSQAVTTYHTSCLVPDNTHTLHSVDSSATPHTPCTTLPSSSILLTTLHATYLLFCHAHMCPFPCHVATYAHTLFSTPRLPCTLHVLHTHATFTHTRTPLSYAPTTHATHYAVPPIPRPTCRTTWRTPFTHTPPAPPHPHPHALDGTCQFVTTAVTTPTTTHHHLPHTLLPATQFFMRRARIVGLRGMAHSARMPAITRETV